MKKVGLIVNPVAGMGGKVGLKGTDGPEIMEKALALGARPEAGDKAALALQELEDLKREIILLTCPGLMGEATSLRCGFEPQLVIDQINEQTTAQDTEEAALKMSDQGVDIILFAGGDGTARNIYNVLGSDSKIPVIGIPAGVKIHSAVYATNPRSAGELAAQYLKDSGLPLRRAEVMDIDEEAFRSGRLSAKLYGYLLVPSAGELMQHLKVGGAETEASTLEGIAEQIAENMEQDIVYIIGPGSTTASIMKHLELEYTLLGVDLVCNGKLIAADVNEKQILEQVKNREARIVVTVIGGQGYIFGRGNQQISAEVIEKVGKENIIVVASRDKLLSLEHRHLLVDTGDDEVNKMLSGYKRVVTGYREELIYPVTG